VNDGLLLAVNLGTGMCVAGAAYASRPGYAQACDWVERDLTDRLRSLRIGTRNVRRWINLWAGLIGATFVCLWIAFGDFTLGLLAAVLMAAGPWYIVRRLSTRRREKIEEQLADAMVTFSSAIRAGLSLAQALDMLGKDCPRPINQEFQQIVGEYEMGKPLERTLTEAKERLKSENFLLFAAALLASRESGGKLNETVERIAKSVVEMQRLERKVRSETAQARKSAVYMAMVPPVILALYAFITPENFAMLFNTLPGHIILCFAVVLNVVAYLWAVRILRADI
jgi:tight adherence protein B